MQAPLHSSCFAGCTLHHMAACVVRWRCRCKARRVLAEAQQQQRQLAEEQQQQAATEQEGGGKQQQPPDAAEQQAAAAEAAAAAVAAAERPLSQQWGSLQLAARLAALDRHVAAVHASLPRNALLLVATGQGDTLELGRRQELKIRRQQRVEGPPWSTADEAEHDALTEQQLRGLCFAAVKR